MTIFEKITCFVQRVFKTNLEVFLEALKLSPNAQGYVAGSVTELLLKRELEEKYGLEVRRIREKWEGRKHPRHRGDFYIRKPPFPYWYVLESKGIKSNSEKWHRLYNYDNLKGFLISHADKLPFVDSRKQVEPQVIEWIAANLPRFIGDFTSDLYEYEEVQAYSQPRRETPKAVAIAALRGKTRDEINQMIDERLGYVMSKIGILETHFVSGTAGLSERTQATPRKDEFNILAVDIVLRLPGHQFVYANPCNLDSSGADPNHLQQNYIMGFVLYDGDNAIPSISEDWSDDFGEVLDTLGEADCIDEKDMQVDNRNLSLSTEDE